MNKRFRPDKFFFSQRSRMESVSAEEQLRLTGGEGDVDPDPEELGWEQEWNVLEGYMEQEGEDGGDMTGEDEDNGGWEDGEDHGGWEDGEDEGDGSWEDEDGEDEGDEGDGGNEDGEEGGGQKPPDWKIDLEEVEVVAPEDEGDGSGEYEDEDWSEEEDTWGGEEDGDGEDGDYEDGDEDWYGDEDEYLTPEQRWFLANPLKGLTALYNKSYAESIANKFPGIHNGYGDAVRHALFTALNANAFGATYAIELGIAHELSGSNNPIEYAMDIHNNQWGANYGSSHDTIDIGEFMDDFNDAVLNGQIIILDFDGNIPDPSSEIDDFVYDGSEHYSGNE